MELDGLFENLQLREEEVAGFAHVAVGRLHQNQIAAGVGAVAIGIDPMEGAFILIIAEKELLGHAGCVRGVGMKTVVDHLDFRVFITVDQIKQLGKLVLGPFQEFAVGFGFFHRREGEIKSGRGASSNDKKPRKSS